MADFQNIAQGAIGGGAAFAATGNPWLIGAGALGGGLMGAFADDSERDRLIAEQNKLTLQGLKQQNQLGGINLRSARRLEREDRQRTSKKGTIGRQLGNLFSRL